MDYIDVSIKILPFADEKAEIVEAMIDDLGFDSYLIEAPYLHAYIKKELFSSMNLKCVLSYFDGMEGFSLSTEVSLVPDSDWNKEWESSFEPIVIDGLCTVKSDRHSGVPLTKYNIIVKPKMSFGTGHHKTTEMMIHNLLRCSAFVKGRQVLDMGTGTGVLAMMAAKLGAKRPVHAIDVDIHSVNSAKEALWSNRLNRAVEVLYGDASLIQSNKYDLILANINRNILFEDMSTYVAGLRSGGELFLSGFFESDISSVVHCGESCGLEKIAFETGSSGSDIWAFVSMKKL